MEYKEIKNLSLEQLNKKALELKKNLFEMRMKNTMGQMSNPLEIRDTKKIVARVLTAITSLKGTTAVKTVMAAKVPKAPKAPNVKATKKPATKTKKTVKKK